MTFKMDQDQVVRWGQRTNGQFCPLEICILNQLKGYPGVNQLLDAYNSDGTYILVLEMVNNCITLKNFMIRNEALHEYNIAQPFFRPLSNTRLHPLDTVEVGGAYEKCYIRSML